MNINENFVTVQEKDGDFEFSWAESSSFTTDEAMKETVKDYEDYTTHAPTSDEKAYFIKTLYNDAARIGFTEGYAYCARGMKGQTTTAEQTQEKTQENTTLKTIRLTIEAPECGFILGIVKKLTDSYPELEYFLGEISGNKAFFEIDMLDDDELKFYTTELNQWFKDTGNKGVVDARIIALYE